MLGSFLGFSCNKQQMILREGLDCRRKSALGFSYPHLQQILRNPWSVLGLMSLCCRWHLIGPDVSKSQGPAVLQPCYQLALNPFTCRVWSPAKTYALVLNPGWHRGCSWGANQQQDKGWSLHTACPLGWEFSTWGSVFHHGASLVLHSQASHIKQK